MTGCLRQRDRSRFFRGGSIGLLLLVAVILLSPGAPALPATTTKAELQLDSIPSARFEFGGMLGERVRANVEHWLLPAPRANPGMIEMFRLRDRQPVPELVPWAGEFVGKYLISAVQALRMCDDPQLRRQTRALVAELIATQAEDGYLGPFPKNVRLLKHWDLWGHYHVIYGLLLHHEQTGDIAALQAARKAADLVCNTYLGTGRRVLQAGDPEMNMAILTAMAMLHRVTGEPRYLEMAREAEKDWVQAGDYLRSGLDGREFYQSPRPRWESLHSLQGLLELWRITGEEQYRTAFIHHWRSIRRWDRRNTGGFSSGEQATGNPFAPTAIETCCTVAWMALTVDYLRLTGDSQAADELELSTFNGGLGAQHPSGRWWTYNTPMDGHREASAHTIVFQARAGTPELNRCSVNAPRVLGLLSEWATMVGASPDVLAVNWYGPMQSIVPLAGGELKLHCESTYPRDPNVRFLVELPGGPRELGIKFRIPAWASGTAIRVNGADLGKFPGGKYHEVRRRWKTGDQVELAFAMPFRTVPGAHETAGKVCIYRGPVLLAFDPKHNAYDADQIPPVDQTRLGAARLADPAQASTTVAPTGPWVVVDIPAGTNRNMRLVDFASAGATGTRYLTWLPSDPQLPAPAFTQFPRDGARIPPGPVRFQWQRGGRAKETKFRVEFSPAPEFSAASAWVTNTGERAVSTDTRLLSSRRQSAGGSLTNWWRVVAVDGSRESLPDVPPAWFVIDPAAPAEPPPHEMKLGPDGQLIQHSLRAGEAPIYGKLISRASLSSGAEGAEVRMRAQAIIYELPAWPEEDFSVVVRVRIDELPVSRIGQVFSAWCAGMDDPLRLVIDDGKLFARIEAGSGYSTAGVKIEAGTWYWLAAVKERGTLKLCVNGRETGVATVPEFSHTRTIHCALGGNPRHSGDEHLKATFADFVLYARALAPEEIKKNIDVK